MSNGKFEKLVKKGIILDPGAFSEDDKKRIDSLTPEEVEALISIRAKLGEEFIKQKAPSLGIVF